MRIVNLTPHTIRLYLPDGEVREVPPSGTVGRLQTRREVIGTVGGMPVVRVTHGEPVGLPQPEEGTIYLVPLIVLQACRGRTDVFALDTSPEGAVRDEHGNVVGTKALVAPPDFCP